MGSRAIARVAGRVRKREALLWAARAALAAFFVLAGVPKLLGASFEVEMFVQIGAGDWLRYAVGVAELAGGLGLLVSPLTRLAAVGLALDMAGATIVNLAVLHSSAVLLTVPLCLALLAVAARGTPDAGWTARSSRRSRRA